MDQIPF